MKLGDAKWRRIVEKGRRISYSTRGIAYDELYESR